MSGHSKWHNIRHQKAVNDAKKGALFTKMSNLIRVAVKEKGSDPETNFALKMAIDRAKKSNMPKDRIERAIKKGSGELEGEQIQELYYEGIGPAKTQFIIKAVTDNKNRSASGIKQLFRKYGGEFTTVNWNFEQSGVIVATLNSNTDQEQLELDLIEAGAQDIEFKSEKIIVYTDIEDLQQVNSYLEEQGLTIESAQLEYVAQDKQEVSPEDKEKINNFIEELDDNGDVSDYYTNAKL